MNPGFLVIIARVKHLVHPGQWMESLGPQYRTPGTNVPGKINTHEKQFFHEYTTIRAILIPDIFFTVFHTLTPGTVPGYLPQD